MTPFEEQCEAIKNGTLKAPSVSVGAKEVGFIGYQLSTHHFNAKLMAKGMRFRGITITQIKQFYGLKGSTASVAEQLGKLKEAYLAKL